VERRGDYLYCLDISTGSGTRDDPFIASSDLKGAAGSQGMVAMQVDRVRPPAAGDVLVLAGDDQRLQADPPLEGPYAYQIFGWAGAGVTGVDVVLDNGLKITATLQNGMWAAWWPSDRGDPEDSRLKIHTATGARMVAADTVRADIRWEK
jgi:hypothetical protein